MGTLEQVTKLIDAGFTKEEIAELFAGEEGKKEPAPADPVAPPADPEPKAPEVPKQEPEDDKLAAAIDKIDKLTESIAKLAIMNSQQPAQDTTQDFLAKIINPNYGKEK